MAISASYGTLEEAVLLGYKNKKAKERRFVCIPLEKPYTYNEKEYKLVIADLSTYNTNESQRGFLCKIKNLSTGTIGSVTNKKLRDKGAFDFHFYNELSMLDRVSLKQVWTALTNNDYCSISNVASKFENPSESSRGTETSGSSAFDDDDNDYYEIHVDPEDKKEVDRVFQEELAKKERGRAQK